MSIGTSSAGQAAALDFGIVNPEFSHFLLSRVNLLLPNLLPALSGSAPHSPALALLLPGGDAGSGDTGRAIPAGTGSAAGP